MSDKSELKVGHSSCGDQPLPEPSRFPDDAYAASYFLPSHSRNRGVKCRHIGQPLSRTRVIAAGDLIKSLLQCLRDGASFAAADCPEVNLAQRDDLRRSATYKYFVCNVELIARNRLFS